MENRRSRLSREGVAGFATVARMANQAFIKNLNERRLLTLLRVEQRLTRSDIARRLGLTRSTVTNLVDGLAALDLVAEVPEASAARASRTAHAARPDMGRPGIDVALHPPGSYFIGVEIGVGQMRMVLLDMALQVCRQEELAVAEESSPAQVLQRIADFLRRCRAGVAQPERLRSLCVTVPGLVRRDGFIVHLPILGWRDVNFLAMAAEQLDLPVLIDNNAHAAAFGEVYGHPKASRDLIVFLKLGNGCGGAAIVNGRLLRGSSGTAAEFGHLRVASDGLRCSCGARGCLEPTVNLGALAHYVSQARFTGGTDPAAVIAAAQQGDPRAKAVLAEYARALGLGLVSLTNTFNPSDIVVGGSLQPLVHACLPALQNLVRDGIVPGMDIPAVSVSRNGLYECAIGAAALAHQQAFDEACVGLA